MKVDENFRTAFLDSLRFALVGLSRGAPGDLQGSTRVEPAISGVSYALIDLVDAADGLEICIVFRHTSDLKKKCGWRVSFEPVLDDWDIDTSVSLVHQADEAAMLCVNEIRERVASHFPRTEEQVLDSVSWLR